MNKDEIGGILTYHCKGHEKTTGQIAGMEGAGEFAIIFKGTIENAFFAARKQIQDLSKEGYRITSAHFIPNEDSIAGTGISIFLATD